MDTTSPYLVAPTLPDMTFGEKREKTQDLFKQAKKHHSLEEIVYSPLGRYLAEHDNLFLSLVTDQAIKEENHSLLENLVSEQGPLYKTKHHLVASVLATSVSHPSLSKKTCDVIINAKTKDMWQAVVSENFIGGQMHMFKSHPLYFFENLFEHTILPPQTMMAFLRQPILSEKLMEKSPRYPLLLLEAFKESVPTLTAQEKLFNMWAVSNNLKKTKDFLQSSLLKQEIQKNLPADLPGLSSLKKM